MRMWNFFSDKLFLKIVFPPMMKLVDLITLQLNMGKVSDYLFHCLFLDNIFLFGLEHGDGNVGAGAWEWE